MHLIDLRRLGVDDRAGQALHRPVLAPRALDLRHPNRSVVGRDHRVEESPIERLGSLGYMVVAVESSEIGKLDAGLSCLSLRWWDPATAAQVRPTAGSG